uniref:Alpha-catulin n=1 Tax=Anopheles farauti TaxID=69004 RepID=A0A182Q8M1_9DIPT
MQRVVRDCHIPGAIYCHQTGRTSQRGAHRFEQFISNRLYVAPGKLGGSQHIKREAYLHNDIAITRQRHTAQPVIGVRTGPNDRCIANPSNSLSRYATGRGGRGNVSIRVNGHRSDGTTFARSVALVGCFPVVESVLGVLRDQLARWFQKLKAPGQREPLQTFADQKISTLVQHRSEQQHHTSEQKMRAIGRVGQAVNLAVERFVTVGETIADDNPEIKQDMYDACKEARAAGKSSGLFPSSLNCLRVWHIQ